MSLKERIHNREKVYGVIVPIDIEPQALENVLGSMSYDFVYTDSQHYMFSEKQLVEFCDMVDGFGMPAHLRIKHTRYTYLVGNLLDLGPSGVEVPQVEEAQTVEEGVAYFYNPQKGIRSWGGGARREVGAHGDRLEYATWWNDYGLLWMQLESIPAVTNVAHLVRPGVDCVSFGPMDLSFSIEAHPHHPFQSVDDCVQHVCDQLKDSDVRVCFRNYIPEDRDKYGSMGVTVFLESPVV